MRDLQPHKCKPKIKTCNWTFLLPRVGNLCLLLGSPLDRARAEVQALLAQPPPASARVWLLTCSDFVEGDGLGHSPPQRHAHPLQQLFLGEEVLLSRKDLSESESCICSRGYGNLQHREQLPQFRGQRSSQLQQQQEENTKKLAFPEKLVESYGAG